MTPSELAPFVDRSRRPRLLDMISAGPPFQVLVVRDASRFSRRDGDEAFGELKRIAQAGIAVWLYQDGTAFEWGNFTANITGIEWRPQRDSNPCLGLEGPRYSRPIITPGQHDAARRITSSRSRVARSRRSRESPAARSR